MAADWFVIRSGKEQGPLTAQQLKEMAAQGKLFPDDLVRRSDMQAPRKASSIKGLLPQTEAVAVHPPPEAIPVQRATDETPLKERKGLIATWQRLSLAAKVGIGVGGGILAMFVLCCGGFGLMMTAAKVGDRAARQSATKVDASELFQDYKANEVAADEKYKGKMLEVNGTVRSIGKDIMGTIYVTFDSGGRFEIGSVQCFFADKHKGEASQVSKGQSVTVRGRCNGKLGNVMVKDCDFVH